MLTMAEDTTLTEQLKYLSQVSNKGITFINNGEDEDFLSYADLYAEARRLLGVFQQRMAAKDELLISTEDNKRFVLAYWACLLGGIVPVPINLGSSEGHRWKLFNIWQGLGNPYFYCGSRELDRLETFSLKNGLQPRYALVKARTLLAESMAGQPASPGSPVASQSSDIAYIQYSSGSTGDPKGVILTHRNLVANTRAILKRSEITAGDTMLSWMPLSHDMGLICFHLTGVMAEINQCLIATPLFIRRPTLWMAKASQHRATLLYSPNFGYHYFLGALREGTACDWDLSAVRLIYNGAEPISPALCAQFVARMQQFGLSESIIFPGYGLAEASVAVSLPEPGQALFTYRLQRDSLKVGDPVREVHEGVDFVDVGHPVAYCQVRICDAHDAPLPAGTMGHIQIKGENVTQGYYNNETATRNLFTQDGWLRTGDLGFTRDGRLVVTGRTKSMIILNGQNYFPQDIEQVAQGVEEVGLGKVVACGIRDAVTRMEELVVFVQFTGQPDAFVPIMEKVKVELRDKLGLLANQVIPVKKIPKTTSGKVQRYLLAEQYSKGAFAGTLSAIALRTRGLAQAGPEGPLETLKGIWRALFGGQPDAGKSFFEQGVTSLQLTQLVLRIQKEMRLGVTISDLLTHPSLLLASQWLSGQFGDESPGIGAAPMQQYYDLSHAQRRFWYLQCTFADLTACNLVSVSTISGPLNVGALREAFRRLVIRHESLRTLFTTIGDEPRQYVQDWTEALAGGFALETESRFFESETALSAAIADAAAVKFDLQTGPLFKTMLWRVGDDRHVLIFVIHHIVFDGWSFGVLARELAAHYLQPANGQAPVPSPGLNIRDVIHWQQQQLEGSKAQEDRRYWRAELDGELPVLDLPFRKRHLPGPTFRGRCVRKKFTRAVYDGLLELAKNRETTLFVVLVAALKVLLHKYTGDRDIIVGTDFSGRTRQGMEGLIGHFLRTVPLRTRFSGDETFAALVEKVKEKVTGAFRHDAYPLDLVIEDLKLKKELGRFPVFNVFVLLQNFENSFSFPDFDDRVTVEPRETETGSSLFDLQYEFIVRDHALLLNTSFNPDVYDEPDVLRFTDRLEWLLSTLTAQPHREIHACDILLPGEREILLDWSTAARSDAPPAGDVVQWVEQAAARAAGATALVCKDTCLTYQALGQQVGRLSGQLRSAWGVQTEDRVAVMIPRSGQAVVALLAVLKSGGTYVPIDPDYPDERIRVMLEDCRPKVVLAGPQQESRMRALGVPVAVPGPAGESREPDAGPQAGTRPGDLAYIMYTSGSSGSPKGVGITHEALLDYVRTFIEYFGVGPSDTVVQQASLSFDTSLEEILPALCAGGRLVVSREGGLHTERLLDTIRRHGVTVLSATPGVLRELNQELTQPTSLRLVISGGEDLTGECVRNLLGHTPVYNTYGPTETTVCATYARVNAIDDARLIGKPIPNKQVYVLDEHLNLLPAGVTGEMYIGGKGVARGYLNRSEETRRAFISSPFCAGERLYRTGDRASWQPDGRLAFAGRKDNQVKVQGYRIELDEIKRVLLSYAPVTDAEVVVRQNQANQPCLVAYFVGEAPVADAALRLYLARYLPYYMLPAYLVQLERFPTLTNTKRDKSFLPVPGKEATGYAAPAAGTTGEKLARIWQTVLGAATVGLDDNFFELGGNSLKATRVLSAIRRQLNVEADLKTVFSHPTIRLLAARIEGERPDPFQSLAPLEEQAYYPASHGQQRLYLLEHFGNAHPTASNLSWAYEISGALDVPRLEEVFATLLARHESLRTTFRVINGRLYQWVHDPAHFAGYFSRADLSEDAQKAKIRQAYLDREGSRPFDLEAGPLVRVKLLRLAQEQFTLLFSIHHIIADAWSMAVLVGEIRNLYAGGNGGDFLPRPRIQYKDYAYWHHRLLQRHEGAAWKAYWSAMLADNLPPVHFPFDRAGMPTSGPASHFLALPVGTDLAREIKQMAAGQHVTLCMIMMTLVSALYFRQSAEKAFLLGTTVAGRPHGDLEDQVGFFVNTLPIAIAPDGQPSLGGLLNHVKARALQAFENQLYPFDLIKELAAGKREMIRVVVSSINIGEDNSHLQLEGLAVQPVGPRYNWRYDFDITCALEEVAGELQMLFLYKTDCYTPGCMEDMGRQLLGIATELLGDGSPGPSGLTGAPAPVTGLGELSSDSLEHLLEQYLKA